MTVFGATSTERPNTVQTSAQRTHVTVGVCVWGGEALRWPDSSTSACVFVVGVCSVVYKLHLILFGSLAFGKFLVHNYISID